MKNYSRGNNLFFEVTKVNQYYKRKINDIFEKYNLSYKCKVKNNNFIIVSTWANSNFKLEFNKKLIYSFEYCRFTFNK